MGLLKSFMKGLFGASPQKFIADIMNLYFTAKGRGYTHEESTIYVIQSRYPYSDSKQRWIGSRLRMFKSLSNEEGLKELVFSIWLLEIDANINPDDIDGLYVLRVTKYNDPIWARFINDVDEVYDLLVK